MNMSKTNKLQVERSKSEKMDIELVAPDLNTQHSLNACEFKLIHKRKTPISFFEKQQNEAINLYNADSTILQMALATKSSISATRHQVMQDIIALSKKPSIREYLTSNTALNFRQAPDTIESPMDQLMLRESSSEHDSEPLDDEAIEIEDEDDGTSPN